MAWQTPKTNWYGATNANGAYEGDYFNVKDYNRIQNNILFLHELGSNIYGAFDLPYLMDSKTVQSYFMFVDYMAFVQNTLAINQHTLNLEYPDFIIKKPGTIVPVPTYNDWNALEQILLDLYENMTNLHQFTWNFELSGGSL